MDWFRSLSIERAIPMPYGTFIEWADGRTTRVEVTRIQIDELGEEIPAVVKRIRWAA